MSRCGRPGSAPPPTVIPATAPGSPTCHWHITLPVIPAPAPGSPTCHWHITPPSSRPPRRDLRNPGIDRLCYWQSSSIAAFLRSRLSAYAPAGMTHPLSSRPPRRDLRLAIGTSLPPSSRPPRRDLRYPEIDRLCYWQGSSITGFLRSRLSAALRSG